MDETSVTVAVTGRDIGAMPVDEEDEEADRAAEEAAGTVMDFIITAETGVP